MGKTVSEHVKTQGHWLVKLKTHACNSCHQLGNKPTRTIPKALGEFSNSTEALGSAARPTSASPRKLTSDPNEKLVAMGQERSFKRL